MVMFKYLIKLSMNHERDKLYTSALPSGFYFKKAFNSVIFLAISAHLVSSITFNVF